MYRIFIVLVLTTLTATAATAGDAGHDRTEELIAAFAKVHSVPDGGSLDDAGRAANRAAFAELDQLFDFQTLTSTAIAPHIEALTEEQQQRYHTLFRETLRMVAYPNAGKAFGSAEYTVGAGQARDDGGYDVAVELLYEEEDMELELTFHWSNQGGTLRMVDLSFDGDPLVKDYQNQFGRLIDKEGADGLIERMQRKHDDILAKRGGLL